MFVNLYICFCEFVYFCEFVCLLCEFVYFVSLFVHFVSLFVSPPPPPCSGRSRVEWCDVVASRV